ncbi:tRNA epoxyqueuosine(34) reductase QueG [Paucibacter sp. M5-1]|uniref:tRNA epoxyqueuosine(34) reductase QueG n=1 Tax=Paucibacter sp. M5-1 TaxID=3015998 RepID=UPI0022B93FF1|nr:tRNA epoxyqueuosine(34) reductase QueG [Paucibacter sp. M5-1]MCZ7882714.1 tRNA epoxyqueuosine(34) reductase QueG [Paucibacter sp. M5-1]
MNEAPQQIGDKDAQALLLQLRAWALELGFSQIGVADIDLSSAEPGLMAWLAAGFHGAMHYMEAHGLKRARPAELVPGTLRVLTVRMDYRSRGSAQDWQAVEWQGLGDPQRAQLSIYARGRDYHKVLRARLQQLATRLEQAIGPFGYRVFTDSAPVLEVELAARSGIGWRGKHTLTLHREHGSMFFLGEIYLDLPLPLSEPVSAHCGQCTACIEACPTGAIVAPYRVDARRCISYLTIEHEGAIPIELRPLMGNRIYGCDDCQLICPWNKFAGKSTLPDFDEREPLRAPGLLALWAWSETEFLRFTEGSAIRRIGHARWRRNLAVAMGNALRAGSDQGISMALQQALPSANELLAEHIEWALQQAQPERQAEHAHPG